MHIRNYIALSALAGTMLFAQQSAQSGTAQQPTQSGAKADQTSHAAHQDASAAMGASTLGKQDHNFLMEAARGGMMEVQVAQMAQQKASSDEIKQYARQLEQDHTKANTQLKAIAKERGVELPGDLAHHQTMVTQLNGLSGAEFDRAFMKMQVNHHKKDVKDFNKQSKNSMDSDLREFASSSLPTLEQHLRQAQSLASQTGSRSRSK